MIIKIICIIICIIIFGSICEQQLSKNRKQCLNCNNIYHKGLVEQEWYTVDDSFDFETGYDYQCRYIEVCPYCKSKEYK